MVYTISTKPSFDQHTQLLKLLLQGLLPGHAASGLQQLLGFLADVLHQTLLAQQLAVERLKPIQLISIQFNFF